jgi:hypothetical protein
MIVPGSVNPLLLATGGYEVPYSLRFRAANSAYMNRTPASAGNRKTATISIWFKRGNISSAMDPLGVASGNTEAIRFNAGNTLMIRFGNLDSTTNAVFRDPSGWGHLVVARDTTQATSTNRLLAWWNGVALTFSSYSVPAQNADTDLFNNVVHNLGASSGPGNIYDGYMAEVNFIDGQALTPSSFGQTDSATGVWVPKKYSGTYGTNGFYLKFADASAATATAIGKDSSGNANNFTPSGISVTSGTTYDQMTDTPTNNYCVLNPVDKNANLALSNANLTAIPSSTADYWLGRATMAFPATGKWYWELTLNNTPYLYQAGIYSGNRPNSGATSATGNEYQVAWGTAYTYIQFQSNNAAFAAWGTNTNPTNGDVLMFAVDADNSTMWVGRNGTWYNTSGTANPATNTDPRFSSIPSGMFPGVNLPNPASGGVTMNFGQRAFSYTPPSGFKALNTQNLPTPSIKKGSLYMDATLRTGTSATASVSSLGFQPDLVWIKSRSAATDHGLYDAVRGVQKQLESNTTTGETTETTGLTAFNSNGYTVGSLAQLNTNTATYVDWAWKEGVTPGFDIVTYVGNGTNRTISHNLGAVPHFIIVKNRTTSPRAWTVYHRNANASPASGALYLNLTDAFAADSTNWNNTLPTSSVFSVGTADRVNQNTDNLVAYLWSEIEGFSKIGSYTGNGSTDGPFVWCGFRPRYVLIKSTGVENWSVQDSARNPYNVVDARLKPNSLDAEGVGSAQNVDFLSNGFKLRNTDTEKNGSGTTYIFAAFAENPFKYARAR